MQNQYDVIIVGGGVVGLALALTLSRLPLQIALVDKAAVAVPATGGFDLRVSAVTPVSQRLFRSLGVWAAMTAERVSPFEKIEVWDGPGSGELHFSSRDVGEPLLGHIIENRVLCSALLQAVSAAENIEFICPGQITAMVRVDAGWQLQINDHSVNTSLLIGADGGTSWVREQARIAIREWDYGHKALVASVKTECPHQKTAWQRFLPTGPLAFLPLTDPASSDQWCSIVWSTLPVEADRLAALNDADFKEALAIGFDFRLGAILDVSPRQVFPLYMRHAKHYVQPALALVGDAAHTLHPLAGQGVNLGLLDVAVLYDVLTDAINAKRPFASFTTLRRYERRRKADNLLMLSTVEVLKQLFANQWQPLQYLRNRGLSWVDECALVKNQLIKKAMGFGAQLPSLCTQSKDKDE